MSAMPKVVIVVARCSQHRRDYGIRFEEVAAGQWGGTWAFALQAAAAQREGYDKTELRGTFGFNDDYPGCPYCRSESIFRCGCGKVACWDRVVQQVTCPWCNSMGTLQGAIDSLSSAGDR